MINHEKQEINGAIAILKQTCSNHESLKNRIRDEYEYHYESMKIDVSDLVFLQLYGAFSILNSLMLVTGQPVLPMTQQIQQRVDELINCSRPYTPRNE
jgi:hypothetical protein